MASAYVRLPPSGGGAAAGVDSFNGRDGAVLAAPGDYSAIQITNTPAGNISATTAQAAIDELDTIKQDVVTGSNSRAVRISSAGTLESAEGFQINDDSTVQVQFAVDVDDISSFSPATSTNINMNPSEDSPNHSWAVQSLSANIDTDNSGFDFGTNGGAATVINSNITHNGTSDTGYLTLLSQNFSLGNGTDPVSVAGVGYSFGFGTLHSNATIESWIQGYGFQPTLSAGSTFNGYINSFYDYSNLETPVGNYTSYSAGPNIAEIKNNNNYTGINLNPTIDSFAGNASMFGLNIAGTYGGFNSGGINFVNINGTTTDQTARYINGINVTMDNVDAYPGAQSSLVFQDLTITFSAPGDNDSYSLQYIDGATAGSESVALVGNNIQITIEDGVSTANQVKAAIEATVGLNAAVDVVVSGVGSNPQVVAGPTNFSGGDFPATVLAASFDGDVSISGALTFGGALSIGKLNAFYTQALVDGGGTPTSIHSLISSATVPDNATISNADTLGINTAMLLTVGDNATVSSSFTGLAALALPAVVSLGSGSTVDQISGGLFAISLDVSAAGGTINNLDLCRSVAIPNGVTTIDTMSGFRMDLPFGNPATTAWGFYESPGVNNYFAGNLLIGGTPGSNDTVDNSSVALEVDSTTKAVLLSRLTSTQRDALTAIDGMLVYNTTSNKFQGYAGGVWVDLH